MPSKNKHGAYAASIKYYGWNIYLGAFESHRRAYLAEELARFWRRSGVKVDDIPSKSSFKDAA